MKQLFIAKLIGRIARAHLGGRNLDEAVDQIVHPGRLSGEVPHYTLTTERRLKTINRLARILEKDARP